MEINKWKWSIDQWFEDKVWTKIPKEYSTPHFFFTLGFMSGGILIFILSLFV